MHQRLVLRRQHHEHEDQRQREREVQRAAALAKLARFARQVHRAPRGEHRGGRRVQRVQSLAQCEPGRHAGRERERPHPVVVVELARPDALLGAGHRVERHQGAVAPAHLQAADVGGRGALRGIEPQHHVIQLVVGREARHVAASQERLQRQCDVARRHAEVLGAVPVHRHDQLRLGHAEVRVYVQESGNRARPRDQRIHAAHQGVEVPVLHHELHRWIEAAERGRIGGEREHAGHAEVELRLHFRDDVLRGAVPPVPVLQDRADDADIGRPIEPDHRERRPHVLGVMDDRLDLAHVLIGVGDGRALGRDDEREEEATILGRHKLPLEREEQRGAREREARRAGDYQERALERACQRIAIARRDGAQHRGDGAPEPRFSARYPQDLGRQHGGQRQGHDPRDQHRSSHRSPELVKQPAGGTREEEQGGEHGDQRHGRSDHRRRDLVRPVDGRALWVLAQLFLVPVSVLQHDDRVVHHDADRQDQAQQRQRIHRIPEHRQYGERRDDRDWDGKRRNHRGAERAEEQEDDEDDESSSQQQGLARLLDRALHEHGRVERHEQLHAARERPLYRGQLGVHRARHVEHVPFRLPHHPDEDARLLRVTRDRPLVLRPGLHARDVAELDELCARA